MIVEVPLSFAMAHWIDHTAERELHITAPDEAAVFEATEPPEGVTRPEASATTSTVGCGVSWRRAASRSRSCRHLRRSDATVSSTRVAPPLLCT